MAEQFRVCIYTKKDLREEGGMAAMWKLLADPLISPLGYGTTDDTPSRFLPGASTLAANEYEDEGTLFVRGANAGFLAMFSTSTTQFFTWYFYIELKAMKGKSGEAWLHWLISVCKEFPILFGIGSSTDEYNAKHRVQITFSDGGRVTKMLGASNEEFIEQLPGIYWLTIFGPELVEHFGGAAISSLKDATVTPIDATQIALVLKEPTRPPDLPQRLAIERKLALSLGAQFFFDRESPDAQRAPIPQLQAAIRSN